MTIHKQFDVKIVEKTKDGGRILINTGGVDRDKDRVLPSGAKIDNYLKNPVVIWGHDYRSPHAVIGKTTALSVSPDGIIADFELRPAANESDPQNIIRLLWNDEWIRTASIGFVPTKGKPNNLGGTDFEEWELLEWSIVSVPANAEALRLAVKGLGDQAEAVPGELLDSGNPWEVAVIDTITRPDIGDARRAEVLKDLEAWRVKFAAPVGIANNGSLIFSNSTEYSTDNNSTLWVKSTGDNWGEGIDHDTITKRGRVLSKKNEEKIRAAYASLGEVLDQLNDAAPEEEAPKDEPKKSGEPTLDANSERDLADALRTLNDLLKGVYQNE